MGFTVACFFLLHVIVAIANEFSTADALYAFD